MALNFIILLFAVSKATAQTLSPSRELYGPHDRYGFAVPIESIVPANDAASLPDGLDQTLIPAVQDLVVQPLNRRGFVHRSQRTALSLENDPLLISQDARIYSPSQAFVAIQSTDSFLMILYPQTSLDVRHAAENWNFVLREDQGVLRISTMSRGLRLRIHPTDPDSVWTGLEMRLNPGSDAIIKRSVEEFNVFLLRGHMQLLINPVIPLRSARAAGLLEQLEAAQMHHKPKDLHRIDLFPGQVLNLTESAGLLVRIKLPDPLQWRDPILRSSPQLADSLDPSNRMLQKSWDLRSHVLDDWLKKEPIKPESVSGLIKQQRWEEAHHMIQLLRKNQNNGMSEDLEAAEILCLFRLQQDDLAMARLGKFRADHPAAATLRAESYRSLLRREAFGKVPATGKPGTLVVSQDELYLQAIARHYQAQWRDALDIWEQWPDTAIDPLWLESWREWQKDLDQNKAWTWQGFLTLGMQSNVLHLPAGKAAPQNFGHRSSWVLSTFQQWNYLIDRSDSYAVHWEPSLKLRACFPLSLSPLNVAEPRLALPFSIVIPEQNQTISIKPFFARLLVGSQVVMDRFGYDMSWQDRQHSWRPRVSWSQEQNLDSHPNHYLVLDPLSEEPTLPMDRSVRRNTLSVAAEIPQWRVQAKTFLQSWAYRYEKARADNRSRLGLAVETKWDLPLHCLLQGRMTLTGDTFSGPDRRPNQIGSLLGGDLFYVWHDRWRPVFTLERAAQGSSDADRSWVETRLSFGLQGRW